MSKKKRKQQQAQAAEPDINAVIPQEILLELEECMTLGNINLLTSCLYELSWCAFLFHRPSSSAQPQPVANPRSASERLRRQIYDNINSKSEAIYQNILEYYRIFIITPLLELMLRGYKDTGNKARIISLATKTLFDEIERCEPRGRYQDFKRIFKDATIMYAPSVAEETLREAMPFLPTAYINDFIADFFCTCFRYLDPSSKLADRRISQHKPIYDKYLNPLHCPAVMYGIIKTIQPTPFPSELLKQGKDSVDAYCKQQITQSRYQSFIDKGAIFVEAYFAAAATVSRAIEITAGHLVGPGAPYS